MARKFKLQTTICTVPAAGTANQTYGSDRFIPDQTFKNIVAVCITVLSQSTAAYVLVQLQDQYKVYIDPVISDLISTENSAGPMDKFFYIEPIPCDGRQVNAGIQVPNSPAADVDVMFTFLLSDELIEINK
jgi:hypothetical protein